MVTMLICASLALDCLVCQAVASDEKDVKDKVATLWAAARSNSSSDKAVQRFCDDLERDLAMKAPSRWRRALASAMEGRFAAEDATKNKTVLREDPNGGYELTIHQGAKRVEYSFYPSNPILEPEYANVFVNESYVVIADTGNGVRPFRLILMSAADGKILLEQLISVLPHQSHTGETLIHQLDFDSTRDQIRAFGNCGAFFYGFDLSTRDGHVSSTFYFDEGYGEVEPFGSGSNIEPTIHRGMRTRANALHPKESGSQ